MQTLTTIAALRAALSERRASGARVGFVPTMGFLHDGHLTLVDDAKSRCECCVLSIFVNPLQFGPTEDLAKYPRDLEGDAGKAAARGVDILFVPSAEEMYATTRTVSVVPERGGERWEGAVRPGHFAGMLTVVAKLFNIVAPDVAVFGQKDAQQAALVRALVRDLDFPLELVVSPIVRDHDGLALSSRNKYLDAAARAQARAIPRALDAVRAAFDAGVRASASLEQTGRDVLSRDAAVAPDYLAVVDPGYLEPRNTARSGDLVILAARIGTPRLLDNIVLGATS